MWMKMFGVVLLSLTAISCGGDAEKDVTTVQQLIQVYMHHLDKDSIRQVDISSDGRRFLAGMVSGEIMTADLTSPATATRRRLSDSVTRARFFDTHEHVLGVAENGEVRIWSGSLDKEIASISFQSASKYAEINDDGHLLAFGGTIYDLQAMKQVSSEAYEAAQSALAISGSRVLTAGFHDGRVLIRDLKNGARIAWDAGGGVIAAAIDTTGHKVLVGTDEGTTGLWKIHADGTGADRIGTWLSGTESLLLLFGATGDWCAIADGERLRLLDANNGRTILEERLAAPAWSLDASRDGTRLALGDNNGGILVWDLKRRSLIADHRIGNDAVYAIAVEGSHVLAGTYGGQISLLRLDGTEL